MQKEKECQVVFNHWCKNIFKKTAAFELKICKGDSIPFSDVKPHQVDALLAVREGNFVWKIPDAGYQNPFDSFSMVNEQAFVVIFYSKSFELIPINGFLLEREKSKRKSLTYDRAQAISTISVPLKRQKP